MKSRRILTNNLIFIHNKLHCIYKHYTFGAYQRFIMNLFEAKCELQNKTPPKVPVTWFAAEAATVIALAVILVKVF